MTQKIESTETAPAVVLRLLNGVLRGGEFVLEHGTTLFVASSPDALQRGAGQAEFPDNAIFIPVDDGGGNFEVDVAAQQDSDGGPLVTLVTLRDLDHAADAASYALNTVRRIAGLDIALRGLDDAWSAEVRGYGNGSGNAPPPSETEAIRKPQTPAPARAKGLRIAGLALLPILLAAVAAAIFWTQSTARQGGDKNATQSAAMQKMHNLQQSQAAQLSASLHGAGQFQVLPGRDGLMYVFAADERDAAWARQSVTRGGDAEQIRVLQQSDESERIERLLDGMASAPSYHTVRVENPARPEIWLSQERTPLTGAARQALAQRITALLPYADTVDIRFAPDAAIAEQAEAGLERLGVQHKKIDNGASVTMSIHGALADGELQKIRNYVEAFYRQWGTHYIHFSIEMEDDMRKGKSFEYGSGGYLKPAASHWDFSVQI